MTLETVRERLDAAKSEAAQRASHYASSLADAKSQVAAFEAAIKRANLEYAEAEQALAILDRTESAEPAPGGEEVADEGPTGTENVEVSEPAPKTAELKAEEAKAEEPAKKTTTRRRTAAKK